MIFRWLAIAFFSMLSFYFGYHAHHGPRGYMAWQSKKKHASHLQAEYAKLSHEKNRLVTKVGLMQEKIDLDILEQLAWSIFRLVDPKKTVMIIPEKDNRSL